MFVITAYEREKIVEHKDELAATLLAKSEGVLFLKALSNYVARYSPTNTQFKNVDERMLSDREVAKTLFSSLIDFLAQSDTKDISGVSFSTGEVAKYFGVSITTINNWLKDGRFLGVPGRSKNKQTRIPENAVWISSTGERFFVKDLIAEALENEKKREAASKDDETKALMETVSYYEKKYGDTYEKINSKVSKTSEELRDLSEWGYILERIRNDWIST